MASFNITKTMTGTLAPLKTGVFHNKNTKNKQKKRSKHEQAELKVLCGVFLRGGPRLFVTQHTRGHRNNKMHTTCFHTIQFIEM